MRRPMLPSLVLVFSLSASAAAAAPAGNRCGRSLAAQWKLASSDLARACARGPAEVRTRLLQHADWLGHVAPDMKMFAASLVTVAGARCGDVARCALQSASCADRAALDAKVSEVWSCIRSKLE